MIVCKFGGTSVAGLASAQKIKEIVLNNSNCKFVVVSALGKSPQHDKKVTDCLFEVYHAYSSGENYIDKLNDIFLRYYQLAKKLNVNITFEKERQEILSKIKLGQATKEYIVSRGEYLSAKLYAKFLKFTFLDAKTFIIFNTDKTINYTETTKRLKNLPDKKYVIGGFYGADKKGNIITFSRGGSDITGAIIAKLLKAEVYENYTDVNGVYDKTPTLFKGAKSLPVLNYKTAEFMADAGTEVVHKSAFLELKKTGVILIVKNTNTPNIFGTVLVDSEFCFNNLFVCVNKVHLLCFEKLTPKQLLKIKTLAEVEKVVKIKLGYIVICKNIYVSRQTIKRFDANCLICSCEKFTMFSNIKLDNYNLKIIKKIQKKLNKITLFCDFLSKDNNFVIICEKKLKNKIVSILNKHLQK